MRIGDREIGPDHPAYVIAEIGVNHDGVVERALELTDAAAHAGADAVKLQFFETDRLLSSAAKLAAYQARAGETDPVAMLRRLELTTEQMAPVVERARQRGMHAIVSVFSVELVDAAAALPWDAFKSASPDVINRPLLEAMGAAGKPLIVSTGASTMAEVERAVEWLAPMHDRMAMLQCVSAYPTRDEDAALGAIEALRSIFDGPVGYSDHCTSVRIGRRAVEAGAAILEKHLTYDTSAAGPDHAASLDPEAFHHYVEMAKATAPAPNPPPGDKRVLDCERDVRLVSRQSITTTRALGAGETIGRADLTIKRPGSGVEPWRLDGVVGRQTAGPVDADVPLSDEDLA